MACCSELQRWHVLTVPVLGKYCDLQTMIHEENGQSIPVHRNYVDAVGSHVKGLTHVPLNNFGGAEAPVTLWRDS